MNKQVKLIDDSFIHFTTAKRAEEILASGKLLVNPPYQKFGIAGVQAISVNHGNYVPGTQNTHIDTSDDSGIVAVWFTTNTLPKYGYVEEVIWSKDVNLVKAKIISKDDAISRLGHNAIDVDDMLFYESVVSSILGDML